MTVVFFQLKLERTKQWKFRKKFLVDYASSKSGPKILCLLPTQALHNRAKLWSNMKLITVATNCNVMKQISAMPVLTLKVSTSLQNISNDINASIAQQFVLLFNPAKHKKVQKHFNIPWLLQLTWSTLRCQINK